MKRSAEKDLAICDGASKGPWVAKPSRSDCGNTGKCPKDLMYCNDDCTKCEHWEIFEGAWPEGPEIIECGDYSYFTDADAKFMCLSREALPYWIRRAMKMEELLKELEWSSYTISSNQLVQEDPYSCPVCNQTANEGHADGCRLAKIIGGDPHV